LRSAGAFDTNKHQSIRIANVVSKTYRVHFSVYPLGSSEPPRVLLAVRTAWISPSWQRSCERGGAWLVEGASEAALRGDETPAAFAERLSIAIWRRLGRYVKVVIDVALEESDEHQRRELGQLEYLKLMRSH